MLPLDKDDIWLVPEGWPHALLPGMKAGARVVVYVQNWAYLLAEWPEKLPPDGLPVHYLAVSRPVAWYVRRLTGKDAPLLPAGIDPHMFSVGKSGKRLPGEAPRIGWMPRKNKAQARHIREIVDASRAYHRQPPARWVEIHNMSQAEVAAALGECDVYLATGFPEGFSLPPLEAMACGCVTVGFSGFGGFEYMRLLNGESSGSLPLWLPPEFRDKAPARPGNGIWVSDGDILGAALAVEQVLGWQSSGHVNWQRLRQGGLATSELYTLEHAAHRALEIWNAASSREVFV